MNNLFDTDTVKYYDRKRFNSIEAYNVQLNTSTTIYVGNLSFYTKEEQIYALFSRCGDIKKIIMGLDRIRKVPCGFCFVEYVTHTSALAAIRGLLGTNVDGRAIRVDLDPGFEPGRQYGRGYNGGQLRDEFRENYDPDRGGFAPRIQKLQRGEALHFFDKQKRPREGSDSQQNKRQRY